MNGEEIISEYYEYDDLGRLGKVYDSTAVWTIDDGTYIPPVPEEPEPEDPEDPEDEIVYTDDFTAYPDLPIYSIGLVDGMRYRLVPLANETDAFSLTYTSGNTTYGVCFEDDRTMVGAVGNGSNVIEVYYEGVLDTVYNITFDGGLTTLLNWYYIYDENQTVVYSVAITAEELDSEVLTFDIIVFGGEFDFDQYMTAYSLRSAGETETLVATYAYDANGNRTSLTYANGTTTTYAYNKANLVTSVLNKKGTTTLSSHSYTYYLDGNIASENENGTTKTYEYDGLGRLTKETKNGTITSYTYDLNGNRATMTQNGVTTAYEYDANNRLLKETVAGAVTTYTYDNNGNLINAWNAGNPFGAYSYNLFGNQVSFTADSIVYTNYTYRPDGLRHSVGDTVHVWDGANIIADVDGNDIVIYIRGINLIYADDGDKTYYHFNAHGDVVALTNANGTKTKSYSYNAFGVEYNEATLDDNPFRYCGEYYDKETQTIYLRARYYDAEQGRFTQEDPIRDGYNWYAYCNSNPLMFVDPMGKNAWAVTWKALEAMIATALLEPTPVGEIVVAVGLAALLVTTALMAEQVLGSSVIENPNDASININEVAQSQNSTYIIEAKTIEENAPLPNQGLVTVDPDAPPVDAGKQGKHVPGHNNNNPDKSQWNEGENGVKETQEAWNNSRPTDNPNVRIGQSSDGRTIKIHIDGNGNIHGYPIN